MAEEERDSHTKQIYTILRKSSTILASGYCYAIVDTGTGLSVDGAVARIMVHIERYMTMLSEMLGIVWSEDELYTIELDVKGVCETKLMPF